MCYSGILAPLLRDSRTVWKFSSGDLWGQSATEMELLICCENDILQIKITINK